MKILHIGKYYPPIEGGIEAVSHFIVQTLEEHDQLVITFNDRNATVKETIGGVDVIRASSTLTVASQPISLSYGVEIIKAIRSFNPDVIYFHYPNPLGALYLLIAIPHHCRLIVHWHSDIVAQRILHRFVMPLESRLLRRAQSIVATSPGYAEASRPLRHNSHKVSVIPCSIDEALFELSPSDHQRVEEIKHRYGGVPIVYFIGRHVEYKGLQYLLQAERLIPDECVILIAGHGPLTRRLQESCTSPRVHWLGRISEQEMKYYYHAADVFAFPSITRNEAFGVALAESMYCGCPSVTFTVNGSGVNWVSIDGETALESPNGDPEALARAISSLLRDPSLRTRMGLNAVTRMKNFFSKHATRDKYRQLISECQSRTFPDIKPLQI
jgi:glycosyltransferase involved in cell wall biosynthesis